MRLIKSPRLQEGSETLVRDDALPHGRARYRAVNPTFRNDTL
jgi:hypothetical protein